MSQILFSSRWGGVSFPPYQELNLATHVGDREDDVQRNRKIVESHFYFPSEQKIIYMNQTHSTTVVEVNSGTVDVVDADALVTREKNLGIAVLVADCLPLMVQAGLYTAAIHVGREGLINGIIENTLDYIVNNSMKEDAKKKITIKASLGPAICGDCYSLQVNHFSQIVERDPGLIHDPLKCTLDIPRSAIKRIEEWEYRNKENLAGPSEIFNVSRCTYEDENYFSHRRGSPTGRFAGVIINMGDFS